MSGDEYQADRPDIRRRIIVKKERRRVAVGEHCSVHFECFETMRYQIHEMLRVENKWDDADAIAEELAAYNPILPGDGDLSATVMFEYQSEQERAVELVKLLGIENHLKLIIGDTDPILATFDLSQIGKDRISSVQYIRWSLDDEQRALLKKDGTVVRLVIDHPSHRAQAVLSESTRREIMNDPE